MWAFYLDLVLIFYVISLTQGYRKKSNFLPSVQNVQQFINPFNRAWKSPWFHKQSGHLKLNHLNHWEKNIAFCSKCNINNHHIFLFESRFWKKENEKQNWRHQFHVGNKIDFIGKENKSTRSTQEKEFAFIYLSFRL